MNLTFQHQLTFQNFFDWFSLLRDYLYFRNWSSGWSYFWRFCLCLAIFMVVNWSLGKLRCWRKWWRWRGLDEFCDFLWFSLKYFKFKNIFSNTHNHFPPLNLNLSILHHRLDQAQNLNLASITFITHQITFFQTFQNFNLNHLISACFRFRQNLKSHKLDFLFFCKSQNI